MQRREQERLRIGNQRPACEHVWRPPRPLAARNGRGEELQRGEGLRLRVPWNRDAAGEPWPGKNKKGCGKNRCRKEQRLAFCHTCNRALPAILTLERARCAEHVTM